MRKIGIHLSYWQTEWSDPLAPLAARAKAAGFDGAEIPLMDPASLDAAGLRVALDDLALGCTCGTGLGPKTDITSPDAAVRQAGLAHLRLCLQAAAQLGSPLLGGVTYAPWGSFFEDIPARRAQCIRSLREAGRMAGDLGISLCLEVINRFEGCLINTVEQGLALLAEVNQPAVKLHLDTFHMNIEEDDIPAAILRAGKAIGHFHCSENNRKGPGQGHIPWAGVRSALDEVGYDGWLVVESFLNPAGGAGRALFVWQPLNVDLDHAASAAARFLREELVGV